MDYCLYPNDSDLKFEEEDSRRPGGADAYTKSDEQEAFDSHALELEISEQCEGKNICQIETDLERFMGLPIKEKSVFFI